MLTPTFNAVQHQKWGLRSLLYYHLQSGVNIQLYVYPAEIQWARAHSMQLGIGTTTDLKYVMINLFTHLSPH